MAIGDALIDEVRTDTVVGRHPGGAALNLAVGMSILGLPTTLAGIVGDDADGRTLGSFLEGHGTGLIATRGPHGTGIAVSDRTESEPRYEFNAAVRERAFYFGNELRDAAAHAGVVAVNCFPLDNADQASQLADLLGRTRGLVAVDPNPRPVLMTDVPAFRRGFEKIAALADIVKFSDEDAALMYGRDAGDVAAGVLESGRTQAVLLTEGRAGGRIVLPGGVEFTSPIATLPGPIVDTMGAGDATLASVLAGVMRGAVDERRPLAGRDWQSLLDDAMRVAAATCRHMGATLRTP
ncbi:carbohydrate kinase [Spelaeicoccus albus]